MLRFRSLIALLFLGIWIVVPGCGGSKSKEETAGQKREASAPKAEVKTKAGDTAGKENEARRRTIEKPKPMARSATANLDQALNVVTAALGKNTLNVNASDLRAVGNSKGEGVFIYVPKTRFRGVERYIIWMVIDGRAYALNGPTKKVTPSLPWPRNAPQDAWKKTRLNMYMATEAIELVFGR